ncbi:hypothetical protein [Streptomyces sp. NPDC048710]
MNGQTRQTAKTRCESGLLIALTWSVFERDPDVGLTEYLGCRLPP